ncbi:LOW QUALITY PROTEIN: serine/threonine-protein kinase Nek2-like [Scylla paramamosain]|uniref:LOW QUALITY PROTEIN: serine/threonine-protein kinase Nek2-like n=1 Tax=Scylla paramamosain TaxID=85552 RepID=UPI003082DAC1
MEVNLLRELNHPHIVRFLHHIVDRRTTTLYILMEYCPGGDLRQLVNKCKKTGSFLPEDFIWKVLKQICEALKTCHTFRRTTTTTTTTTTARSKVILHRDIKPANVFLGPGGEVKLGDFGLARTLTSDLSFATSVVGTPYYMSPEVVEGQEYNDKSDMWSLGCLIYELCALQPPFMAATHAHLAAKIKEARYPPIPVHYTLELRELLDELLTPQYFMRPSALMLLHHPSLTSRFPPLSHAFSLSLSHAGGREEVEKEEAARGMIQGDGETEICGRERRGEEEEEDKKRKVEDGERSNKQENSPNFPSLPDTPHTCPSNTDTTPAPTHLSATYHIPTTPLDAQGGRGRVFVQRCDGNGVARIFSFNEREGSFNERKGDCGEGEGERGQ